MVNQILEKHIIYLLFSLMLLSVVNIIIGLQQIAVSGTINGSSVLSALSDHAVGFFINRNHFGAMNYASIPMATALILIGLNRVGAVRVGYIFSGSICTIIFIIGLSVTYSRASLAFGIIATMVSGCMIALRLLKSDRRALAKLVSLLFVTVIIALILFVFYALAEKRGLDDVRRLHISETTIDALWALLPLGSGFGTFVPIFMIYEPDMYLERYFMNHAHNDYLEIFLEGGLPSVMIMLVFLFWLGRSSIALWFSNRTYGDNVQIGRTATLSIALLMIHSLLDYPLRTTALISVAALLTALIMRACQHRESDGRTPSSEKW